jgi:ABC-type polysaccharide/polyol phosphate export permease
LPRRIPGTHFARNLVERRTLILQLVKRDFQQRYIGSAAGWLWGLIHPLVLLAVYTFIFGYVLSTNQKNYPLVLFAGMLPWLLFSETVLRSSGSLVEQANLITKTVFPSEIVPVTIFLSSVVSHFLIVALFAIVAGIWLGHLSPLIFLLPVFTLLLGLFAIGLGWIAASLQVYLRDTTQVVAVIMTFWMWATPIFLDEQQFSKWTWARWILKANPLVYVLRAYRDLLLGRQTPLLKDLGVLTAAAAVTFICGGLFFRYLKRGFADVL